MKTCYDCKLEKDESEYHANGTSNAGTPKLKPRCKPCQAIYERDVFHEKLIKAVGGEENLKCERCGYDKYEAVLEFHHNDPNEKELPISKMKNYSYARIKSEIDKCTLLCANCHRELHFEEHLLNRPTIDP